MFDVLIKPSLLGSVALTGPLLVPRALPSSAIGMTATIIQMNVATMPPFQGW